MKKLNEQIFKFVIHILETTFPSTQTELKHYE